MLLGSLFWSLLAYSNYFKFKSTTSTSRVEAKKAQPYWHDNMKKKQCATMRNHPRHRIALACAKLCASGTVFSASTSNQLCYRAWIDWVRNYESTTPREIESPIHWIKTGDKTHLNPWLAYFRSVGGNSFAHLGTMNKPLKLHKPPTHTHKQRNYEK